MAEAVIFLAGPRSSFITGEILRVGRRPRRSGGMIVTGTLYRLEADGIRIDLGLDLGHSRPRRSRARRADRGTLSPGTMGG